MKHSSEQDARNGSISRRRFFQVGGAVIAGGTLSLSAGRAAAQAEGETKKIPSRISRFRTLGRTGFQASDISIGCGGVSDENVIRYAYDHGINYFDTAEGYGNGASETTIGNAMPHMDRKKIFITTKLPINPEEDTVETIRDRFGKCLERLKTDHVDALMMHSVDRVDHVKFAQFHAVANRLISDGKIRFRGISCHGPREEDQNSMAEVLVAAADDGRFDVMLLSYNFLNREEAEKVLAACKAKNIGTTAMKTMPGYIDLEHFNPDDPQEDFVDYINSVAERGISREEAIERINNWVDRQMADADRIKPFAEKHGITTNEELREKSILWVLKNPDMNTVTVSMNDFEALDRFIPLSGTELTRADTEYLKDWDLACGHRYCRHGCVGCMTDCPEKLAVSTIMRYSYYFAHQGREKHAMKKYARLGGRDASPCLACNAPCAGVCPHGVDIQGNMVRAHMMLKLA